MRQMYTVDPEMAVGDDSSRKNFEIQEMELQKRAAAGERIGRALGGEASIWTEQVCVCV